MCGAARAESGFDRVLFSDSFMEHFKVGIRKQRRPLLHSVSARSRRGRVGETGLCVKGVFPPKTMWPCADLTLEQLIFVFDGEDKRRDSIENEKDLFCCFPLPSRLRSLPQAGA
ncbi:hypothetical protein B9G55_14280 [Saccharibacillus sp. O16]|nr:hypothetical protein B9G55_14280 [Saccharibacillus sp. O16]